MGLAADSNIRLARPRVFGHRGASALAPENTLLAFQLAVSAGADAIETDARLSRDEEIALIHDERLGRTTDRDEIVGNLTLSELADFDAGHSFTTDGGLSYPFRGCGMGVPGLRDLFTFLDTIDRTVLVNVELKAPPPLSDRERNLLVRRVVATLDDFDRRERVIVSSFDATLIDLVGRVAGDVRTAYLVSPPADLRTWALRAIDRGHDAIHPLHTLLGGDDSAQSVVAMIHEMGLEINVWTVNDWERARALAAAGVDGIMSDDPGRLRAALDTRGAT